MGSPEETWEETNTLEPVGALRYEWLTPVAGNLTTQRNAIRMLYERAQVIREYLDGAYMSMRRITL